MVGRRAYDLMYRVWAPWDGVGVRDDLARLLDSDVVSPSTHPHAVDLGCGTGANVVHLATMGYEATGVDFSEVALAKARERARRGHVERWCTFVEADLTSPTLAADLGTFDLLVDFGALDDLQAEGRAAMARNIAALARPGAVFLWWCFYVAHADLPRFSVTGPSRIAPPIEPGEEHTLFAEDFEIEEYSRPLPTARCFLLRRRG